MCLVWSERRDLHGSVHELQERQIVSGPDMRERCRGKMLDVFGSPLPFCLNWSRYVTTSAGPPPPLISFLPSTWRDVRSVLRDSSLDMADSGRIPSHSCKCLNVRIHSLPPPSSSPEEHAGDDFVHVFVGEEGIDIVSDLRGGPCFTIVAERLIRCGLVTVYDLCYVGAHRIDLAQPRSPHFTEGGRQRRNHQRCVVDMSDLPNPCLPRNSGHIARPRQWRGACSSYRRVGRERSPQECSGLDPSLQGLFSKLPFDVAFLLRAIFLWPWPKIQLYCSR